MTDDRRERPRRLRDRTRLRGGGVVVTEYDGSGRAVRETHYTADEAWVTKVVERAVLTERASTES
jgi:hypothetical protein